ncbi:hypothetical protein Clacol_010005 [Clathrus columnatus]|uniref:Aminoglycoside phosphotransferase domain-containing protein n=1 Tax=Clathrus columnatus TaxID=1419009 RepID=A0AAV5APL9_9AGAM|nr:hypothetical protein Clacol_010005 [Clathrus columnatus]
MSGILTPSPEVLKRFNINPSINLERLSGGRGLVYRAGNVVLKRLDMSVETLEWLSNTFAVIKETKAYSIPTIRLSAPLYSQLEDGAKALIVEGWTAWNWLDGVSSGSLGPLLEDPIGITKEFQVTDGEHDPTTMYKWDHIIKAGEAFSALMLKHKVTKPAILETRKDPWGLADRIAWNELDLTTETMIEVLIDNNTYPMLLGNHWKTEARYLGETLDILNRLHQIGQSMSKYESDQIIHGDLTGNVLFSLPLTPSIPPGVIDISPYFRPPSFSTAIIIVDALACENAPVKWALTYLQNNQQVEVFARALIFRIVSDYLLGVAGVGAGDDYTCPMEVLREISKELS